MGIRTALEFAQREEEREDRCQALLQYLARAQRRERHRPDTAEKRPTPPSRRSRPFPREIIKAMEPVFHKLFDPRKLNRSTGVVLFKLADDEILQPDLFGVTARIERVAKVYDAVDGIRLKYGKHTLFLGSSFYAHKFAQHLGERGDIPERRDDLFKGETGRQRLGIPMFLGEVK